MRGVFVAHAVSLRVVYHSDKDTSSSAPSWPRHAHRHASSCGSCTSLNTQTGPFGGHMVDSLDPLTLPSLLCHLLLPSHLPPFHHSLCFKFLTPSSIMPSSHLPPPFFCLSVFQSISSYIDALTRAQPRVKLCIISVRFLQENFLILGGLLVRHATK